MPASLASALRSDHCTVLDDADRRCRDSPPNTSLQSIIRLRDGLNLRITCGEASSLQPPPASGNLQVGAEA